MKYSLQSPARNWPFMLCKRPVGAYVRVILLLIMVAAPFYEA